MTELVVAIYKALRRLIQAKHSAVTYKELAEIVSRKRPTHQRSASFHAALTELTTKCRENGVPCIAAVVCSASTNRPSEGYYKIAHPRAKTDEELSNHGLRPLFDRSKARVLERRFRTDLLPVTAASRSKEGVATSRRRRLCSTRLESKRSAWVREYAAVVSNADKFPAAL